MKVICIGDDGDDSWRVGPYAHCLGWPKLVRTISSADGLKADPETSHIFDMEAPHNV